MALTEQQMTVLHRVFELGGRMDYQQSTVFNFKGGAGKTFRALQKQGKLASVENEDGEWIAWEITAAGRVALGYDE